MDKWSVQDAKARFSEVMDRAAEEGPQTITRHGVDRVVVLSVKDYHALAAQKPNFKEHLLGGPKFDDFSIPRSRDSGRKIVL